MKYDNDPDKILLTKEVAQILRVKEDYVRELIRERKIKAYKEGRRGGYRIMLRDVHAYVKLRQDELLLELK